MKKTFPDLLEPFAFRSISRKRKSDTNQEIRKGYLSCSKHQKNSDYGSLRHFRHLIPEKYPKTFISAIKIRPCPVDTRIPEIYYTKKGVDWL